MKQRVLFGTTNPEKRDRLRAVASELNLDIVSLRDSGIDLDVDEDGLTPRENAIKKVKAYYALSGIPTFSIDSGLYIDKFSKDKQPGVFVRRINGKKADDEEMLRYYINELNKVGGESKGRWIISIALAKSENEIYTRDFIDETYFTSRRSRVMKEGAPLGSIQIDLTFNKYKSEITEEERKSLDGNLDKGLYEFLKEHLIDIKQEAIDEK